jgi:hypothetical protein
MIRYVQKNLSATLRMRDGEVAAQAENSAVVSA